MANEFTDQSSAAAGIDDGIDADAADLVERRGDQPMSLIAGLSFRALVPLAGACAVELADLPVGGALGQRAADGGEQHGHPVGIGGESGTAVLEAEPGAIRASGAGEQDAEIPVRKVRLVFSPRQHLGLFESLDDLAAVEQRQAEFDPGIPVPRVELQRCDEMLLGGVVFGELRQRFGEIEMGFGGSRVRRSGNGRIEGAVWLANG